MSIKIRRVHRVPSQIYCLCFQLILQTRSRTTNHGNLFQCPLSHQSLIQTKPRQLIEKRSFKNSNWIEYVEPSGRWCWEKTTNPKIIQHSLYDFVIFVLIDSCINFQVRMLTFDLGNQNWFLNKSDEWHVWLIFLLSKLGCESEAFVARSIKTLDLVLILTATQVNLIKTSSDMF